MCACGSTSWSPECVARKGSRVRKNLWHNAAYQSCVKGTHGFDNWRKLGWNMRCETLLKELPAQEASTSQPSCRAASDDGAIPFRKYQSTSRRISTGLATPVRADASSSAAASSPRLTALHFATERAAIAVDDAACPPRDTRYFSQQRL